MNELRIWNIYVVVLSLLSLLKVVFLSLELDDALPELDGLLAQFVHRQAFDVQGFDADRQRDLLLFFQLLLGLVALQLGIAEAELKLYVFLFTSDKYL